MGLDRFPPHLRAGIRSLGADPEFEKIHGALSTPISELGLTRRSFLRTVAGAGGATVLSVGPLARAAGAAPTTPLGEGDPILVVIQLGGGNDGLNTVVPALDPAYATLRSATSVAQGALPLGADGLFLHPSLPKLAARYQAGKVAIVRGVGNVDLDHSHFSAMATWMSGASDGDRSTGWLGRYLDSLPEADRGLAGVTLDASVPLHLLGLRSDVSALGRLGPFGSNRTSGSEVAMYDAIRQLGVESGLGTWAKAVGAANRSGIDRAQVFAGAYSAGDAGESTLTAQLALAARVINANVGARVLGATLSSFDTHHNQRWTHQLLLADLDLAIETFYAALDPRWADQVVLMTFSEFGRRAADNGSGTDHGTSAPLFVIGDRVRGGMHGAQPSLTDLDSRGDLAVTVDFRSVYASVLARWLGADPAAVLGGTYDELDLFRSSPPPPPTGPVLPTDARFAPFDDAGEFVLQQFHDFRGTHPSESELLRWGNLVFWGFWSVPVALEQAFLDADLHRFGLDPVRVAWIGTGRPPEPEDVWRWTAMRAGGQPLDVVATEVVASSGWIARHGRLWGDALIRQVHLDALRSPPTEAFLQTWRPRLVESIGKGAAAMLTELAMTPFARLAFHNRAVTALVFAAMLRRPPGDEQNRQWGAVLDAGAGLKVLLSHLYDSTEYRERFT